MPDLKDGELLEVQGSGSKPYVLKNVGGVYSCTCPAWRNQSIGVERRTCKHLRNLRGEAAEEARLGGALPARPTPVQGKPEAPPLLLAETWDGVIDPTGWFLSEKLDGVRAYWTGKEFLSRQGNLYHAPDWFTADLPAVPLDGELWLGRKKFQRTVAVARRQDRSEHWKELTFVVFDAPKIEQPFEARMEFVADCLQQHKPAYTRAHDHQPCQGLEHLRQELARLESVGAEELMLRRPGSRYEGGRSSTLLKVKSFHDAEARVLGHQEGAGRHKGRLGALLVELPDGTTFSVGTGFSDAERDNPPPVGSVITFRFQELSDGGVPRFPSFVGVRQTPAIPTSTPKGKASVKTTTNVSTPTPKGIAIMNATIATTGPRRFEYRDGKSDKFWEITQAGLKVDVRYGRNGTTGQTSTKSFADEEAATRHINKLIQEKTGKGYKPVA